MERIHCFEDHNTEVPSFLKKALRTRNTNLARINEFNPNTCSIEFCAAAGDASKDWMGA